MDTCEKNPQVIETSTPAGGAAHTDSAVAASFADESSGGEEEEGGGELDLDGIDDLEIDKVTACHLPSAVLLL